MSFVSCSSVKKNYFFHNNTEPDKDSMSDILSANDLKILGLVLAQTQLGNLKEIGMDIEDPHLGKITKEKFADALKQIGQDRLALVLRDKQGR